MSPDAVLNAFLKQCLADRMRGGLQSLEAYQQMWPGHEDLLRTEYLRLGTSGEDGSAQEPGGPPEIKIGGYRVLRELGRGGQGIVYLADDEQLHRQVALKVLTSVASLSPQAAARFSREAAAASRLDHPNICAVYNAGVADGVPYIVMRYVPGETVAHKLKAARQTSAAKTVPTYVDLEASGGEQATKEDTRAEGSGSHRTSSPSKAAIDELLVLIEKVARALHVAHESGIVHRDVKPGNLMVTESGEPVVLDFGMAYVEQHELPSLTNTGDIFGTPVYMSPEQLLGHRVSIDRRTDIWSLGVVLYEILTLQLPFQAPTREGLYRQILSVEPVRLRRLVPSASRDLEVVIETALSKDPARRYQTALDLAEDLRRVRERLPIQARPAGPLLRLGRWAQRRPALAASLAAVFLSLCGGLGVSIHLLDVTRRERDEKSEAMTEAVAQRNEKERALTEARVAALDAASTAALQDDPMLGLLLGREAARLDPVLGRRALRTALHYSQERARLKEHYHHVLRVGWSNDGSRLLTCSRDGTARIWSAEDGHLLATLRGHEGAVLDAAWSPSGDRILTVSDDRTARIWRPDGGVVAICSGHQDTIVSGAWLPDERSILTASIDGTARIWSVADGSSVVLTHGAPVVVAIGARGGERILIAGKDGLLRLFNAAGQEQMSLRPPEACVPTSAAFRSDGGVVAAFEDGRIVRWSGNGQEREVIATHTAAAWLRLAPEDDRILSWSEDGTAVVRDPGGNPLAVLTAGGGAITAARWSPSGQEVITGSANGELRLHDLATGENRRIGDHEGAVLDIAWQADGGPVATASADMTARIWTLVPIEPWTCAWPASKWAAFSPDGSRLDVWCTSERRRYVIDGRGPRLESLEELPEGEAFVRVYPKVFGRDVVAREGELLLRDEEGRVLARVPVEGEAPDAVGLSPDDSSLASMRVRSALSLVDLETGEVRSLDVQRPEAAIFFRGRLYAAGQKGLFRFGAGGELEATADWSADSKSPIVEILPSPAGDRLACRTLWDLFVCGPDLELIWRQPRVHEGGRAHTAWSPSGELLAAGSTAGLFIFDESGKQLSFLATHGRCRPRFLGEREIMVATPERVRIFDIDRGELDSLDLPGVGGMMRGEAAGNHLALLSFDALHVLVSDAVRLQIAERHLQRELTELERMRFRDLLGPENAAELQAWAYIRQKKWNRMNSQIAAEALEDPELSKDLRERVRRICSGLREDLFDLNNHSWAAAMKQGADAAVYRQGLTLAERLVELVPSSGSWWNTAGVLRYRLGDFAGALATLEKSDLINRRERGQKVTGEDTAVIALCAWHLGRKDVFQDAVTRLRTMLSKRKPSYDEKRFITELEETTGVQLRVETP